jgi:hypothetical protein
MDFEKLLAAVPDIGDQKAREMAIARVAHASGAADERERNRALVAALATQRDGLRADSAGLRGNLSALLGYVEHNTCTHEQTHRSGVIWTICDGCGQKWSDDKNPFKGYIEPAQITNARIALISAEPASAPAQPDESAQFDAAAWIDAALYLATTYREASTAGVNAPYLALLDHLKTAGMHWRAFAFLRDKESAPAQPDYSFQQRVQPWMTACFGAEIAGDKIERNHRFLEEALELVQSCDCTAGEAHQLVDYVYGRPVGEPTQEVGGVMVTLAALCLAQGMDMHAAGETELARIWTKVEQIRAKHAAKPKHSPFPSATAQSERKAFEAWWPENKLRTWRVAGCDKDRGPVPSAAWGEGFKADMLIGFQAGAAWQARASVAQSEAPKPASSVATCPNCGGTKGPHALDPQWRGRCECAQPEAPAPAPTAGMTPFRVAYFLRRFLRDEKMLGPNEQAALRYAIEVFEAPATAQPVAQARLTDAEIDAIMFAVMEDPDATKVQFARAVESAVRTKPDPLAGWKFERVSDGSIDITRPDSRAWRAHANETLGALASALIGGAE